MNYLIDSYVIYAASVLAASAVIRSLFGAAFPLFTTYMYKDLGIHWASSIPAFLSLACMPFPYLFWRYGAAIRAKCKYAAEAAAVLEKMRSRAAVAPEKGTREGNPPMLEVVSDGELTDASVAMNAPETEPEGEKREAKE